MANLALAATTLAALAFVFLVVKVYVLVARATAVVDKVGRLVDTEMAEAARAWGEAARGVQNAVGKLDQGLESLSVTLARVDRVAQRLEPEQLTLSVLQPALAKVGSWLGGVRRGLSEVTGHKGKAVGEGVETEVG
ncbi:MAG: hypothetical protein JXA57_07060 [Armatimonadetes bacterium]|nr:hypothetical protein [Armatimonadota bacterium]